MPTYCYEKPDGSIVEKIMTIAEMEKFDRKPVVDGETWKRRVDVEMGGHSDKRRVAGTAGVRIGCLSPK